MSKNNKKCDGVPCVSRATFAGLKVPTSLPVLLVPTVVLVVSDRIGGSSVDEVILLLVLVLLEILPLFIVFLVRFRPSPVYSVVPPATITYRLRIHPSPYTAGAAGLACVCVAR